MRPIDADYIAARLEGYLRDCEEAEDIVAAWVFADVLNEIYDAPTIDSKGLQPVVRCWKCRHWYKGHCTYGLSPCCTLQTYANYYCPYGAKESRP